MGQLSKTSYKFWSTLPETKAVQQLVLEKVAELRIALCKRLDHVENPQVQAAFLNGLEWGHIYDNLFDFGDDEDAEDGGSPAVDKAEARRSAVRGQY